LCQQLPKSIFTFPNFEQLNNFFMNSHVIVAVAVAIDETLKALGHEKDKRAQMSDVEVLTMVEVVYLPEAESVCTAPDRVSNRARVMERGGVVVA
jgi:hypothetical protein